MAFWSSQRIEKEQAKSKLVHPFDPARIQQGSYELSLSREVLITPENESSNEESMGSGPALTVPPGQFALVYTEEQVNIPSNTLSFISVKAKIKLKGLVNISGFHVDPGYSGRLKFSLYNAGNKPICLTYGEPCFLLWFADLDETTREPYDRKHVHCGQKGITADDREQMSKGNHSPAALDRRLEKLEHKLNLGITIGGAILGALTLPLLVGVAIVVFQHWFDAPKSSENSTTTPLTRAAQTLKSNTPPQKPSNPKP